MITVISRYRGTEFSARSDRKEESVDTLLDIVHED